MPGTDCATAPDTTNAYDDQSRIVNLRVSDTRADAIVLSWEFRADGPEANITCIRYSSDMVNFVNVPSGTLRANQGLLRCLLVSHGGEVPEFRSNTRRAIF